jgi:RND family efflux transporter MFP subunit
MTVALATAIAIALGGCDSKPNETLEPPTVTVTHPNIKSIHDHIDLTGNTVAVDSVILVARVEGYLDKIHFADGALVKKDQLLFTIQQQQYKDQLQQAVAQIAAQRAALFQATIELARYKSLLKQQAATETEVDHWQYEHDSSVAGLSGAEGQLDLASRSFLAGP